MMCFVLIQLKAILALLVFYLGKSLPTQRSWQYSDIFLQKLYCFTFHIYVRDHLIKVLNSFIEI